jgi:predicted O-methyltransferase YrrM
MSLAGTKTRRAIIAAVSTDAVFAAARPLVGPAKIELGPAYLEYVFTVSDAAWAISLDVAAFLLAVCRAGSPTRIADLGSGFSSYVFRTYARERRVGVEVVSVDDSTAWREKTSEFLRAHELSTDALLDWSEFEASRHEFDLVFHDLGDMTMRARCLDTAVRSARPEGIVVLDDLHMAGYPGLVSQVADAHGRRVVDLMSLTRDDIGRYAWALAPGAVDKARSA